MKTLAVRTIFPPMGTITATKKKAFTDEERESFFTNIDQKRLDLVVAIKRLCRQGYSPEEAKIIAETAEEKFLQEELEKRTYEKKTKNKRFKLWKSNRLE